MFAGLQDSDWTNRSHRGLTTLVSFGMQALAVSVLFALPLIYTQTLPLHLVSRFVTQGPPPVPPAPAPPSHSSTPAVSNLTIDQRVIAPTEVPRNIAQIDEQVAPPPVDLRGSGVDGGTGNSRSWNSMFGPDGAGFNLMVPPPPKPTAIPRVSHIMEGNLIYRVRSAYPPLARQARIQGSVVLQAVISREGAIEKLQVLSGHPMLMQAAVEAVRQWRYRPYVLNGEPVEVETQVTVNFVLSGG